MAAVVAATLNTFYNLLPIFPTVIPSIVSLVAATNSHTLTHLSDIKLPCSVLSSFLNRKEQKKSRPFVRGSVVGWDQLERWLARISSFSFFPSNFSCCVSVDRPFVCRLVTCARARAPSFSLPFDFLLYSKYELHMILVVRFFFVPSLLPSVRNGMTFAHTHEIDRKLYFKSEKIVRTHTHTRTAPSTESSRSSSRVLKGNDEKKNTKCMN